MIFSFDSQSVNGASKGPGLEQLRVFKIDLAEHLPETESQKILPNRNRKMNNKCTELFLRFNFWTHYQVKDILMIRKASNLGQIHLLTNIY